MTGDVIRRGNAGLYDPVAREQGRLGFWTRAARSRGNIVAMLSKALNRHIFDKTGITDVYTFHLRFAHDESTPGNLAPSMIAGMFPHSDLPSGPSIFTALERVGLKLVPIMGPQGYFVVDHIERPTEN